MSIQLTVPPKRELKPRITVIGVGGAGGNAVNNMIKAGLEGVDFVVANTDAQALAGSNAERRIQMGVQLTEGLGAGSDPSIGTTAAEEAMAEIVDQIQGSHMVFVTAGMGGGTGTGAAPVIARACREQGILTIGVVTKPFEFEGPRRMKSADIGISALTKEVDTLIIIPNQNLFRVANEQTGFVEAFAIADEVLHSGVASVTDLMTKPGLINLDFADVKMVMNEMGKAMMGTGEAEGDNRAIEAAEAAIANPLLEDDSMQGATGVLINITGGTDMTLYEVDEAANRIKREVYTEANIIIGAIFDESLEGTMRVSVVATGIANDADLGLAHGIGTSGPRIVHLTTPTTSATSTTSTTSTGGAAATDLLGDVNLGDVNLGDVNLGGGNEIPIPAMPDMTPDTMPKKTPENTEAATPKPSVPEFLVPPTKPQAGPLPRRKQSFIDRVLRGRKDVEAPKKTPEKVPEKVVAKEVEKPAEPSVEPPVKPEAEQMTPAAPTKPAKIEESVQAPARDTSPKTRHNTTPLELDDAPMKTPAVAETINTPEMVSTGEDAPKLEANPNANPNANAEQSALSASSDLVEVVLETKTPAKLMPETNVQTTPDIKAEVKAEIEAKIEDVGQATSEIAREIADETGEESIAVSDVVAPDFAPSDAIGDAVSNAAQPQAPAAPQPEMQSTMQSSMSTGGPESDQLDIPAFLRRS